MIQESNTKSQPGVDWVHIVPERYRLPSYVDADTPLFLCVYGLVYITMV